MKKKKKRNLPTPRKRRELAEQANNGVLAGDLTPQEIVALRVDLKESFDTANKQWEEIRSSPIFTEGLPTEDAAGDDDKPVDDFPDWYRAPDRSQREEFCACDSCGKSIQHGNALVTVNRQVAQVNLNEDRESSVITVIDDDVLLTLCAGCGNQFNAAKLQEHLQSFIHASSNTLEL